MDTTLGLPDDSFISNIYYEPLAGSFSPVVAVTSAAPGFDSSTEVTNV